MDAKTAKMIAAGRVAIYARYSTDLQHESSVEDQTRRARDAVMRMSGDPTKALVFPDYAVSGGSMMRPGLEALMRAVEEKQLDAILTEDVSRISRDVGDAAHIFKRLGFAGVPLIGLSDGIDTSQKAGKLNFTFKSMMAEWYVDEIRARAAATRWSSSGRRGARDARGARGARLGEVRRRLARRLARRCGA